MRLRDFRTEKALSLQGMAELINSMSGGQNAVSASMVDRWEKGAVPRRGNLRRIEQTTGGQVTFVDFYTNDAKPARKPRSRTASVAAARKAAATRARQKEARA